VITHAELAANDFRKTYGEVSLSVIPSAIPDRYSDIETRKIVKDELIRVGFLGRLESSKGVRELVCAMKNVVETRPETRLRLYIAGSGPLAKELTGIIPSHVEFLGPLEYSQIDGYFRQMDYSIVPSKFDAFALVVAESMMNGTPTLVSTGVGAAEYLVDGEECLKFEPTVSSIQETLMKAEDEISNIYVMRRNARGAYLRKFTVDRWIDDCKRILLGQ